jgi:selenocysteine-specific elongation factor
MSEGTRPVVVGTAGHIDHGKSTLVLALTGIDPDRWVEEKRRGITIDLGFAHAEIEGWPFSFVDVPGHERFVHNMLAGASGIDLALLVVAADEGVMPQTREHLAICALMNMRGGVVALTKTDAVEEGLADLAEEDLREAIAGTFLEGAEVVRVSGKTHAGLDALRAALARAAAALPADEAGPWPRLPVDRVFAKRGFGTVVTGTLQGGPLRSGDELRAVPGGPPARVRGLQVHDRAVDEAPPHRRVAVNLQGIDRDELRRGMMLVPRGREVSTRVVDASLLVLDDAPAPIEQAARVRVHHGTAEVLARVRLPGGRALEPGSRGAVQLRLERPVAALPGDRFIVRRYSPVTTIGGGEIVDVDPPRWKRSDPLWPDRVGRLIGSGPEERLADLAEMAGTAGVSLQQVVVRIGTTPQRARDSLPPSLALLGQDRVLTVTAEAELIDGLGQALDEHHRRQPLEAGPTAAELRARLCPEWSWPAFEDLLGRAGAAGELVVDRERVRRPGHDPRPAGADAEDLDRLEELLRRAGVGIRSTDEVAQEAGLPRERVSALLASASRGGRAIRVKDGVWLSAEAWQQLVSGLARRAREGEWTLDVAGFKEMFGISRKHAIPLLERLDDAGLTKRAGNARRIQPGVMDAGPES